VLHKEYFDCPQRDSHAVHYILKWGERGVCTLKNRDVLHRPLCAENDKIPEIGTSAYILHLSGLDLQTYPWTNVHHTASVSNSNSLIPDPDFFLIPDPDFFLIPDPDPG
jgi:hypothetical protein